MESFQVSADFAMDGVAAGDNLAARFKKINPGVWEYRLTNPPPRLQRGTLTVSIRDRQGNTTRIERVFSVGTNRR